MLKRFCHLVSSDKVWVVWELLQDSNCFLPNFDLSRGGEEHDTTERRTNMITNVVEVLKFQNKNKQVPPPPSRVHKTLQHVCTCPFISAYIGARVACWFESQIHDRKVASSDPGRGGRRIFLSRVNFVCWLLFGVHSIPVLLQWHVKDPGHFAKSADGRLHLNTHTTLTQQSRSGLTMPLSRLSVGNYPETSSHATC